MAPAPLRRQLLAPLRNPTIGNQLARHTLVHPIRHGAPVLLPRSDLDQPTFDLWNT